jgi:hypothetical protein
VENQSVSAAISALVSVLVTTVLAPYLFARMKAKEEKERRDFDIRYKEYARYVTALANLEKGVREDGERFWLETLQPHFDSILQGSFDVVQFQRDLSAFTLRSAATSAAHRQELAGLRLIGSKDLIDLVDQYGKNLDDLTQGILGAAGVDFQEMRAGTAKREHLDALARRSQELNNAIIAKMRAELGTK